MKNRVAHSSMNAGVPVVAAGEVKIEKGVLKSITTHSGHYRPSLFNVYRLLEHLSNNGVDTSKTNVMTFQNPSKFIATLKSRAVYSDVYKQRIFKTPANKIFASVKTILTKNVAAISQDISLYSKGGLKSALFKLKDTLSGSALTQRRNKLAVQFSKELNEFKEEIVKNPKSILQEKKLETFKSIIEKYDKQNKLLSREYNKMEDSGRLASKFNKFKEQIGKIKSNNEGPHADIMSNIGKKLS